MKVNNWINLNYYKYMFNGVANSNETIYLELPNDIKNVYTYAYISELPYTENLINISLEKHKYTLDSFSYDIKLTYGDKRQENTISKYYYANYKESYKEITDTFSGKGFNLSVLLEYWSRGNDLAWCSVDYRYYYNSQWSSWTRLYYGEFRNRQGSYKTDSKQYIVDTQNIFPLTEVVKFEVLTKLKGDSEASVTIDLNITPYNYIPSYEHQGKVHWFAFVS